MKRKLLTITTLILGMVLATQAQVLPSPSSQGNVKNGTNPVSLFSGTVSMGVPLYTATANNGARVPVSIGYNASGIKVNEVAGPVGLGWQLYAGGTITRVTRGIPDEYGSMVSDPSSVTSDKIQDILDGEVDSEKDLFFFNFPGGGGKFIFEQSLNSYATQDVWCNNQYANNAACVSGCQADCVGDPNEEACQQNCAAQCAQYTVPRWVCEPIVWTQFKTFPYSNIEIEYTFINFSSGSWKITDSQGVVYTFGQHEVTTSSSTEPNESVYGDEYGYVSTWYLTSITYPNVPSGITFSYSSPVNLTTITSEYKTIATGPGSGSNRVLTVSSTEETKNKTVIGQRFIESVNFPKGSINFTYADRDDLTGGKRLTQVDLKDKAGSLVSSTILNQSYFSAENSLLGGTSNCPSGEECKRLKLESVYRDGGLVQSFTYRNEEGYSGTGVNYYELPPRDSYHFDHWGYWNAGGVLTNNYQKYPRLQNASVPELPGVNYQLSTGVDRVPYLDYALANILTRIDHPTGGYTKYEYYGNNSRGGARIVSIKSYDESDQLVSGSSYNFVGETAVPWPSFHYMYDQGTDKLAIYQRSKSSALGLNGPRAGFNTATVTDLMGQGKVVYTFNNDYRSVSTLPTRSQWGGTTDNYSSQGSISNILYPPYPLYSMIYFDRGSYDMVQSYDAADNLVSEKTYTYDPYNIAEDYVVSNLALEVNKEVEIVGIGTYTGVFLSKYDIAVRTNRLASVTDTFYDTGGNVASTTTFDYHPTYKNLRTTSTAVKNDDYGSKSLTKYPGDISSSTLHDVPTLSAMVGQNIIGIPVQQESQIHLPDYATNEYKTNGVSITSFKTEQGLKVPNKTYTLPLDAPVAAGSWSEASMIEVNHMVSYNADGLVAQQVGLDGVTTNYTYDSDGYLIQTDVNGRTTDYAYNPLVGIQQVTDANNRKVTYEYDQRNRLLQTRNDDDEITTRYRYESASDDPNLNAEIGIQFNSTEGNKEDFQHSFSLYNINCPYGECSYSWNWGDGNSGETGTSESHTYINPGTYNVEVTITNPEYATPVIVTKSVSIANYNLSATININPNGAGQYEDFLHGFSLSNNYCPTGGCTYSWNWGDGTTNGTGLTPSHWFKEPGDHDVTVTITNSTYNETATVVQTFNMANYNLSATINITPNVGGQLEDLVHGFSLSNQYCPTGGCTYTWNWGDATPNSTGTAPTHWYKEPGDYNVTVTIANSTYNETANVVQSYNMANYNVTGTINIAYANACQYENDSHGFSLVSIYCPAGGCSYSWNWGDGTPNTAGSIANHTYTSDGAYTATMTITNTTYNESATLTKYVSIGDENWSLSPVSGPTTACIAEPPSSANDVRFWINTGTLSGCMASYTWSHSTNGGPFVNDFASTSNSEAWLSSTDLIDEAVHQIRITVADQAGRTETDTKTFTVSDCSTPPPPPPPPVTWSISNVSGPSTLFQNETGSHSFTASMGSGDHSCSFSSYTYTWQYRQSGLGWVTDNETDSQASIPLSSTGGFSPGDTYEVKVTAQDNCGDTDSYTKTIQIQSSGGGN